MADDSEPFDLDAHFAEFRKHSAKRKLEELGDAIGTLVINCGLIEYWSRMYLIKWGSLELFHDYTRQNASLAVRRQKVIELVSAANEYPVEWKDDVVKAWNETKVPFDLRNRVCHSPVSASAPDYPDEPVVIALVPLPKGIEHLHPVPASWGHIAREPIHAGRIRSMAGEAGKLADKLHTLYHVSPQREK